MNNFVFAGFGIPFGLTFIVLCQGAELITANYMFCTFACLAAKPEDRVFLMSDSQEIVEAARAQPFSDRSVGIL